MTIVDVGKGRAYSPLEFAAVGEKFLYCGIWWKKTYHLPLSRTSIAISMDFGNYEHQIVKTGFDARRKKEYLNFKLNEEAYREILGRNDVGFTTKLPVCEFAFPVDYCKLTSCGFPIYPEYCDLCTNKNINPISDFQITKRFRGECGRWFAQISNDIEVAIDISKGSCV